MAYTVRRHRLSSITRAPLPQGDRRARPALAGGAISGECNRIVLDAGDVFDDAFAVRCPSIDAEGEVSSRRGHLRPLLPQSSSASRFTAGAARFFILSQSGERPERYIESLRFDTMASSPILQAWAKTVGPSPSICPLKRRPRPALASILRSVAHPIQLDQVESIEDGVTDKLARMAWAMMARGESYKEPVALAA